MHLQNHPEFAVTGLQEQDAAEILGRAVAGVRRGRRFEAGKSYDDVVPDRSCAIVSVDLTRYRDWFAEAVNFYQDRPLSFLQCVWPDDTGRFPWNAGYDQRLREQQPLLSG